MVVDVWPHPDGYTLLPPPVSLVHRPRCLHCCRSRAGLDADLCCSDCRERGHGGPHHDCGECERERRLLGREPITFTGP